MKLMNLYLGIKDQMPMKRFVKNLRKGHVLSHFTVDGKEKVSYTSKRTATLAAEQMFKKKGVHFSNYKCIYCDGYHLGKNRENK